MATLKATCLGFSRLPSPLDSRGIKNYYAVIDADSVFNLSAWRELNVREPKEFGRVPNLIRESLLRNEAFSLINRGLTVSAKEVRYDNKTGTLEIDMEDKELHSLLDGGHTYLQLEKFQGTTEERQIPQQFVRVEILTGLERDELVDVVAGRNTSNQVKEVSLDELQGAFKELKAVLAGQSYANAIAYSEYETMPGPNDKPIPKPISVVEILKCLVCLDAENFNGERHPHQIATSDDKAIKHFRKYQPQLRPLYVLLPSILQLWDTIYRDFVTAYNQGGGKAGWIGGSGNRFFKELKKTQKTLYFIAETTKQSFADGLRLPILGGFRAALKRGRNGQYAWREGINPSRFFTDEVGTRLTRVICQSLIDTQDVTRTTRTEGVWAHCYTEVENSILKRAASARLEVSSV